MTKTPRGRRPRPRINVRPIIEALDNSSTWNRESLAKELHVEPSTLGRWLRGEANPHVTYVRRISEILHIHFSEMWRGATPDDLPLRYTPSARPNHENLLMESIHKPSHENAVDAMLRGVWEIFISEPLSLKGTYPQFRSCLLFLADSEHLSSGWGVLLIGRDLYSDNYYSPHNAGSPGFNLELTGLAKKLLLFPSHISLNPAILNGLMIEYPRTPPLLRILFCCAIKTSVEETHLHLPNKLRQEYPPERITQIYERGMYRSLIGDDYSFIRDNVCTEFTLTDDMKVIPGQTPAERKDRRLELIKKCMREFTSSGVDVRFPYQPITLTWG